MIKRIALLSFFLFAAVSAQEDSVQKILTPRDSAFVLFDTTETCVSKFGKDTLKWNNCINEGFLRYYTYKKGKENGPAWQYFKDEDSGKEYYSLYFYKNGKYQYDISFHENGFIDDIDYENRSIHYGGRKEPFTGRDSLFNQDTLLSSSYYENGIKDGWETTYYAKGQIEYERMYKKGKKEGKETCYREDGQIWWESNYKNGKEIGLSKEYYADGSKEERGSIHWITPYMNGEIEGTVKGYYQNGQIWVTRTYKKGKQEGKQIEYSQKTGKVISTAIFKNDELVGDKQCVDGRFGSKDLDCTPLDE